MEPSEENHVGVESSEEEEGEAPPKVTGVSDASKDIWYLKNNVFIFPFCSRPGLVMTSLSEKPSNNERSSKEKVKIH